MKIKPKAILGFPKSKQQHGDSRFIPKTKRKQNSDYNQNSYWEKMKKKNPDEGKDGGIRGRENGKRENNEYPFEETQHSEG